MTCFFKTSGIHVILFEFHFTWVTFFFYLFLSSFKCLLEIKFIQSLVILFKVWLKGKEFSRSYWLLFTTKIRSVDKKKRTVKFDNDERISTALKNKILIIVQIQWLFLAKHQSIRFHLNSKNMLWKKMFTDLHFNLLIYLGKQYVI